MGIAQILAEVSVPSLDISLEIVLPSHITVKTVIKRITEIVAHEKAIALDSDKLSLYSVDLEEILADNLRIDETRVEDSCRLAVL